MFVTRWRSVHLVTIDERCRTSLNDRGQCACPRLTLIPRQGHRTEANRSARPRTTVNDGEERTHENQSQQTETRIETRTENAGPPQKGRTGVSAGQPRWRWDLNPRWTFTHTRFRVLRISVRARSPASATCSTRLSAAAHEPRRTTTNETKTETRQLRRRETGSCPGVRLCSGIGRVCE
jgi:hypothetical protein